MARENEEAVTRKMRELAEIAGEDALPSAGSMWWRLELRMRRERAQRAQAPLVWMARVFYVAIAILTAFLAIQMVDSSNPELAVSILFLIALAVPVSIIFWTWHRSGV